MGNCTWISLLDPEVSLLDAQGYAMAFSGVRGEEKRSVVRQDGVKNQRMLRCMAGEKCLRGDETVESRAFPTSLETESQLVEERTETIQRFPSERRNIMYLTLSINMKTTQKKTPTALALATFFILIFPIVLPILREFLTSVWSLSACLSVYLLRGGFEGTVPAPAPSFKLA